MYKLTNNKIVLLPIVAIITIASLYILLKEPYENPLLPRVTVTGNDEFDELPDFASIKDVTEKKHSFFEFMYPIIEQENAHILRLRNAIKNLSEKQFEQLTPEETQWLMTVSDKYKLDYEQITPTVFNDLQARVDFIPPSLALTQAALESGWGSSRFSKQGNNLFGQWCFSKGCGIVPNSRDEGRDHEVADFDTVNESVRAYLHNLNTFGHYTNLRQVRSQKRLNGEPVKGTDLAATMLSYSEEGEEYVRKITKFMMQNKLQRYTQPEI